MMQVCKLKVATLYVDCNSATGLLLELLLEGRRMMGGRRKRRFEGGTLCGVPIDICGVVIAHHFMKAFTSLHGVEDAEQDE